MVYTNAMFICAESQAQYRLFPPDWESSNPKYSSFCHDSLSLTYRLQVSWDTDESFKYTASACLLVRFISAWFSISANTDRLSSWCQEIMFKEIGIASSLILHVSLVMGVVSVRPGLDLGNPAHL